MENEKIVPNENPSLGKDKEIKDRKEFVLDLTLGTFFPVVKNDNDAKEPLSLLRDELDILAG